MVKVTIFIVPRGVRTHARTQQFTTHGMQASLFVIIIFSLGTSSVCYTRQSSSSGSNVIQIAANS